MQMGRCVGFDECAEFAADVSASGVIGMRQQRLAQLQVERIVGLLPVLYVEGFALYQAQVADLAGQGYPPLWREVRSTPFEQLPRRLAILFG